MGKSDYNAEVSGKILITPDIMVLRVRTDSPRHKFKAGQYTKIGVLGLESRSPNSAMEIGPIKSKSLISRPYSIASVDYDTLNFEFYISQVKSGQLTPRLFNLSLGSRMWVDDRILGLFQLNETPNGCNIVMVATGTGIAPYISFIRSHLHEHKNTKLVVIHGAACSWDLGYYSELSLIKDHFPNFYYYPTLIKPDKYWIGLNGYIEEHINNILENQAGIEIDPTKTHFFLCGNPKMVKSITGILEKRNYVRHSAERQGSLHIEDY
jgi:ferredoxin/flavodoxin---NADP+ reductase